MSANVILRAQATKLSIHHNLGKNIYSMKKVAWCYLSPKIFYAHFKNVATFDT